MGSHLPTSTPYKTKHTTTRVTTMSAILESDDDGDLTTVLSGAELIQPPKLPGNYSARTQKRWSSSSRRDSAGSSTDMDGVHAYLSPNHIFPAQLYSTESGRLFHAGKVLICLVGLPARGKTRLSVSLTRYLRWLGVKTHPFHVSDYRRKVYTNFEEDVPEDYFSAAPSSAEGIKVRQKVLNKCLHDIASFFEKDRGQVAIYDALNITKKDRSDIHDLFSSKNIKVLFIESIVDDDMLIHKNVSNAAASPDYEGWDPKLAKADYLKRINANAPIYEQMNTDGTEAHLRYIKFINFGERLVTNNSQYGYLINRIVFFLMNSRVKTGCVYFARCGKSDLDKYVDDEVLNDEGLAFSETLAKTLLDTIAERKKQRLLDSPSTTPANSSSDTLNNLSKHGFRQPPTADGSADDSFVVWTATRKRTSATANPFRKRGITVRERYQLNQLNPGIIADMDEEQIKTEFAEEFSQDLKDPYHHRYPRAESYHDLAVRMEPLLLEMERMSGDILIIAHESSLRVLYGYLMACSCYEIPSLQFPRNEIVEISYTPYENHSRRITIEGFDQ
ncbi:CYFA0S09e00452g1_1 [Cyberlindnera fabianii]|uniref:CYFA0S09e00452g1_1 n=1 Tax=Cyberlindnera fabianii TaxID=36022 RepID=A0A061AXA1_CYBFA|nr:CYFA0S09e00452g1_1 [Cyberlindnera fabianii]